MTVHDVIVIGGGPVGLATAYHLSKRSDVKSIAVLERFSFGNQKGASAGISRQFRIPYPQEYMVQLAVDALDFWAEIQKHTDQVLLDTVGTLWFGDPDVQSPEGNINGSKKAMNAVKPPVPFDDLNAKDVESKYHFKDLPDKYVGIFQKDGAAINIPGTIDVLLKLVKQSGKVTLKDNFRVSILRHVRDTWHAASACSTHVFQGKKLVIVPGPYMNEILNLINVTIDATYWEMTSAYFKKKTKDINYPTWIIFQKNSIDQYYGFPEEPESIPGNHHGYIRVAPDYCLKPLQNPEDRTGIPNPTELKYTEDFVSKHMTHLEPKALFTSTCLVALSNDSTKEFILDFAPDCDKTAVFCATGWVAKFIPLLGSILSDLAITGETKYDISPFQLGQKRQYVRKLIPDI